MKHPKHPPKHVIMVCGGGKCTKRGGHDLRSCFKKMIKKHDLKDDVWMVRMDCTDQCDDSPVICFQPQNIWHLKVDEKDAENLFQQYIGHDRSH